MVLTESGLTAHTYLWIAGVIAILMFMVYVFICEHEMRIDQNEVWIGRFLRAGVSTSEIVHITHDYSVWYYKGLGTCVAYGDWNDKCERSEYWCAGGGVVGDGDAQARAVKVAIDNGSGYHPMCPLI